MGEAKPDVRPEVLPEEALPWIDLEPSVELDNEVASASSPYGGSPRLSAGCVACGRVTPGAALVHCAAGKDRTGTLVALALSVAEAERQAIIDDYAASSERVEPRSSTGCCPHRPTPRISRVGRFLHTSADRKP